MKSYRAMYCLGLFVFLLLNKKETDFLGCMIYSRDEKSMTDYAGVLSNPDSLCKRLFQDCCTTLSAIRSLLYRTAFVP